MRPLSTQKRLFYFIGCAILFLLFIPIVILYSVGYRIDSTFSTFRTGAILVQTQFADADISLNGVFVKSSGIFQRNIFLDNLKPAIYTIDVKKEGYQSWKQKLMVSAEQVSTAAVFMLPTSIDFSEVTPFMATSTATSTSATSSKKKVSTREVNVEYAQVTKLFSVSTSTVATTTRTFQRILLTKATSTVTATWIGQTADEPSNFCVIDKCVTSIVLPVSGVRTLEFYPGRSDVMVVARAGEVYAQQIDARDMPPVQKIYQGTKPEFRFDGETIYVRDAGKFFKADL